MGQYIGYGDLVDVVDVVVDDVFLVAGHAIKSTRTTSTGITSITSTRPPCPHQHHGQFEVMFCHYYFLSFRKKGVFSKPS